MTAFWRGCPVDSVDEKIGNLRALLSESDALNECPTDPSLAEQLQYCPADLILPLCDLMGHHSDPVNVSEMWKGILGALNDADGGPTNRIARTSSLQFHSNIKTYSNLLGNDLINCIQAFDLLVSQLKNWLSSSSHQHIASAL